jgi:hypothetical protein
LREHFTRHQPVASRLLSVTESIRCEMPGTARSIGKARAPAQKIKREHHENRPLVANAREQFAHRQGSDVRQMAAGSSVRTAARAMAYLKVSDSGKVLLASGTSGLYAHYDW